MLVVLVLGIVGFFFKTIMELVKYMACMSCLKYEGIPVSETKNEEDSSITYEIAVDQGEKTSTFKYRLEKDEQPFTLNEPIPVRIDSKKIYHKVPQYFVIYFLCGTIIMYVPLRERLRICFITDSYTLTHPAVDQLLPFR